MSPAADPRGAATRRDRAWRDRAACRTADPDLFFPDPSDADTAAYTIATWCAPCPVREDCLTAALALPRLDGIWGGLTPADRRHRQRRSRPPAPQNGVS